MPGIHSLPLEILVDVFLRFPYNCTYRIDQSDPTSLSHLVVSAICQRWRRTAIETPSIWQNLKVSLDTIADSRRFLPAELWLARSNGAPLYLEISHPSFLDRTYNDDVHAKWMLNRAKTSDQETRPVVDRMLQFLEPLMPQVCHVSVASFGEYESMLVNLLKLWKLRGTLCQARVLKCQGETDDEPLQIRTEGEYGSFFKSLQVLHLHNTTVDWEVFSLVDLVELELCGGLSSWDMEVGEFANILGSCSRLETLRIEYITFQLESIDASFPKPVVIPHLRRLRTGGISEPDLELLFKTIHPGETGLELGMTLCDVEVSSQRVIDAVTSYVNLFEVASLSFDGYPLTSSGENCPYFVSQLGPLPNIKTLVLESWMFCDTLQAHKHVPIHFSDSSDDYYEPMSHESPRPLNDLGLLWPKVRSLYIRNCVLDEAFVLQLVSTHSLDFLCIRDCQNTSIKMESHSDSNLDSDSYHRMLAPIVPHISFDLPYQEWPLWRTEHTLNTF